MAHAVLGYITTRMATSSVKLGACCGHQPIILTAIILSMSNSCLQVGGDLAMVQMQAMLEAIRVHRALALVLRVFLFDEQLEKCAIKWEWGVPRHGELERF